MTQPLDKTIDNDLIQACANDDIELIKLLLDKDANVNFINQNGYTALMVGPCMWTGSIEVAKLLLDKGADTNIINKDGKTAFMLARSHGAIGVVQLLLEYGADPNSVDEYGRTVFMEACDKGYLSIVKLLLEQGTDANSTDEYGRSVLMNACIKGNVGLIDLLLQYDANPNFIDPIAHWTPLIYTCSYPFDEGTDIIKLLLKNGAHINTVNKEGKTALDIARDNGFETIIKLLKQ